MLNTNNVACYGSLNLPHLAALRMRFGDRVRVVVCADEAQLRELGDTDVTGLLDGSIEAEMEGVALTVDELIQAVATQVPLTAMERLGAAQVPAL